MPDRQPRESDIQAFLDWIEPVAQRIEAEGRPAWGGGLLPTRCLNEGPTDRPACPPGACTCYRPLGA